MKNNNRRDVDGILLLNKPLGITSNGALQQVKRIFNAKKAGHTGSLDPLASGVLPICFGKATKLADQYLQADKSYLVRAKLGVATATGDAEGEITAIKPVPPIADMQGILNEFLGATQQIPSMYSALKHKGQPLYKLARQNIEVERKPRDIFLTEFRLIEQVSDSITCMVACSKGTYIRTLIEDLGARIGCGAHVTMLERTKVGEFSLAQSYSIEYLQAAQNLDLLLIKVV